VGQATLRELDGRSENRQRQLPPRTGRSRWRRSEGGAVLVEAAFVLPVLILFIMGMVDFGFAFNNYISLRQGTREAARQAAVSTTPAGPWSCPTTGLNYVGNLAVSPGLDAYSLICYAKTHIGLNPQSQVRVSLFWDNPYTPDNKNFNKTNSVVICTQYPLNSVTGVFSPFLNGKTITAKTEIRIEQPSTGDMSTLPDPIQETSLSSWPAFCSAT
jgi:hypothetical protein